MIVELARMADFALGELNVRPSLRRVDVGERSIKLEPRVMQVLVLLAQNMGKPVDRDMMVEQCWGGVIVGDDAIQRCIGRLRRLASEIGGFEIETIARVGYRLLPDGDTETTEKPTIRESASKPPSLAFQPVEYRGQRNLGHQFAQLLNDDIAAAMSINRELVVLTSDAQNGAQFIVAIDVRESKDDSRIHCTLIERMSRRIVWSDVLGIEGGPSQISDGIPDDDLVVDLAARISAVVIREVTEVSIAESEAQSAWQAVVRANAAYQRIDLDSLEFGICESRKAVELDPSYAPAHAALANALAAHFELGGARAQKEADEARKHCDIALALAPEDASVLAWTAHALLMITRPAEGLALAEKAAKLAPAHPIANLYLARHYLQHGRPDDAERALDNHARAAPLFPWKYWPMLIRGLAKFMQGDIVAAEHHLSNAASLNPVYPYSWISLMVLGALKQNHDDMRRAADRLRQLDGNDDLDLQLARLAHSYPDPEQAAMIERAFRIAWEA